MTFGSDAVRGTSWDSAFVGVLAQALAGIARAYVVFADLRVRTLFGGFGLVFEMVEITRTVRRL